MHTSAVVPLLWRSECGSRVICVARAYGRVYDWAHAHTHTIKLKQQVRMVEETKLKLKEGLMANSKLIMRWTKRPMYNCWDAWSDHAAELRRRDKVVVEHFFRCFLIPSSCLCPFLVSGSNLWISCSFSRGFGTECSMQALFWR